MACTLLEPGEHDEDEVTVIYHSAVNSRGFSEDFCKRYQELTGIRPEPWSETTVRIDNAVSMRVIDELGADSCGRGLTVGVISRRQLPALRILDTEGCEYPDLDSHRFITHHVEKHLATAPSISREVYQALVAESRQLHLRVVSRANLSPVSTSNRFRCLSE